MYLPQGFKNTPHLLSFAVVNDDGLLVDANEIGFAIFKPDGKQEFPGIGFRDVTTGEGKVGVGRYYAFDRKDAWMVPDDATIGVWKITWRWKIKASDSFSTFTQEFEVVDKTKFNGFGFRTYLTPTQVRNEGLDATELSDTRLESLILQSQMLVERITQNVYRPVFHTARISGHNSDTLFLDMAIIGIEEIRINNSETALSTNSLAIAFSRTDLDHLFLQKPDYRRNPQIGFQRDVDFFARVAGRMPRGGFDSQMLAQKILGVFGFLESDGTVPQPIQEAMLRLVFVNAPLIDPDNSPIPAGPLIGLGVDRHTETYQITTGTNIRNSITRTRLIDELLRAYKSPLKMATPRAPSRLSRTFF